MFVYSPSPNVEYHLHYHDYKDGYIRKYTYSDMDEEMQWVSISEIEKWPHKNQNIFWSKVNTMLGIWE